MNRAPLSHYAYVAACEGAQALSSGLAFVGLGLLMVVGVPLVVVLALADVGGSYQPVRQPEAR
mgnify:CR=1 FL=1